MGCGPLFLSEILPATRPNGSSLFLTLPIKYSSPKSFRPFRQGGFGGDFATRRAALSAAFFRHGTGDHAAGRGADRGGSEKASLLTQASKCRSGNMHRIFRGALLGNGIIFNSHSENTAQLNSPHSLSEGLTLGQFSEINDQNSFNQPDCTLKDGKRGCKHPAHLRFRMHQSFV
jgi:hypothetical protein